jgi:hypothetical protein
MQERALGAEGVTIPSVDREDATAIPAAAFACMIETAQASQDVDPPIARSI